jgi:hypothetical protein
MGYTRADRRKFHYIYKNGLLIDFVLTKVPLVFPGIPWGFEGRVRSRRIN